MGDERITDKPSIFTKEHGEGELEDNIKKSRAAIGPKAGFDYPATLRGKTAHFEVYYDPALGANGTSVADAVLATCEADYATLQAEFGGITPPGLPFQIVIAALDPSGNGGGGAYHWTCADVTLYCDIKWLPALNPDYTKLLVIAEEVEVFEAAQGTGWNCGSSNGEGLSRVLAEIMYPNGIITWMYSAPTWLDSATRPDYIGTTDPTDRNYVSTGCAVLFLYYLHSQLNYSWAGIVQAAGNTLENTYQTLTGKTGAYNTFTNFLQAYYPLGKPSGLKTDNPFPLGKNIIKDFKDHKDFKEHKEIKEWKEPKEIKEWKEKEKEWKEHKEYKEPKEIKEFKEFKEPKEIKEKDKEIFEGPPPPGAPLDADAIRKLTERIDRLEKMIGRKAAFIEPKERPEVGKKVFKKKERGQKQG